MEHGRNIKQRVKAARWQREGESNMQEEKVITRIEDINEEALEELSNGKGEDEDDE